MSLPAPNLDDRTFQSLVDEAKLFVQRRCPTWTDHNVSDPGVTLIEAFAWMTDILLYRLNRVPDRNYIKFLELIDVHLLPPAAAKADVTFRLSTPQPTRVVIPANTAVQTPHGGSSPVTFTSRTEAVVVPGRSRIVASVLADGSFRNHTAVMGMGDLFQCFSPVPVVNEALYIGLDRPAPACVVRVHVQCDVGGQGIDPNRPPLVWEAWSGTDWEVCVVERDGTGGLNVTNDIEVHLPSSHEASTVEGHVAAWLRCRVVDAPRRRAYESSPTLHAVTAEAVGVTTELVHADRIVNEFLGRSDGTPGQSFTLRRTPVLNEGNPVELEVATPAPGHHSDPSRPFVGTKARWTRVKSFADRNPDQDQKVFMLDATTGEVRFGPVVRTRDGGMQQCGEIPAKDAQIRVVEYWAGGGRSGNVAARTLRVLQSSIPYVDRVYNRMPATGGVDAETIDEAKLRGPIELRARNRAVTAEDFEVLARDVAPELARIHCGVDPSEGSAPLVRLLVVPHAPATDGRIRFEHMVPAEQTLTTVREHLDLRRLVGTRLVIEPPSYVGVSARARVRVRGSAARMQVESDALEALYRYFNPISGGPEGNGWPFGRAATAGEIYSVLQVIDGVDTVDTVSLHIADPRTRRRGDAQERVEVGPYSLVFSVEHEIELT
jgi:predicted phage baseplate assembly protein